MASRLRCGGKHPHVHRNCLRPADALEGLLEQAQEFDLGAGRQITDFVEKSAQMRLSEAANAPLRRPGKRAALVTEQFAFQQVFGNRRAINRDKRPLGAGCVDRWRGR